MKYILLTLLATALLAGCDTDNPVFEGSEELITITREFPLFDRIIASDELEVNVSKSDSRIIEITLNENLQNQLITNVSNSTLELSLETGSYRNGSFVVNIQIPDLKTIELNDNTTANVEYDSSELAFEVNDSSNLNLKGSADELSTKVSDDGRINGFSFTTEVLNTSSSDASKLQITCTGELNGTVDDASEVLYRGMPTVNAQTSDAGRITDAN